MDAKTKVFVACPTTGTMATGLVTVLRRMEKEYGDRIEFIYPDEAICRIFHDHARNKMVEAFLESDAEVMWFVDSDIIPNDKALTLITDHFDKWDLAGCPYPVFMTPSGYDYPQVTWCVYNGRVDEKVGFGHVPLEGTGFVDGIATGCIFIRRHIFEKLSKPYFEFKYDKETRDITEGEDLGFIKKVNDLGYKFFIDYSLVCNHYKKIGLLDVSNYAKDYANRSVAAYDAQIRKQLSQAEHRRKSSSNLVIPKSKLILPD